MTAPLEMLRKLVTNPPVCRSSPHKIVAVTVPELSAAIAAIEERDAEIERMEAEIDKRCCCEFKMPEGTPAGSTCTFHDAQTDQIATLTRQLAESRAKLARYEKAEKEIWERTPGWLGEQLPALAAYLAGVEQQRDAMRGVLEEIRASAHTVATVGGMTLIAEWVVEQCDRAMGAL